VRPLSIAAALLLVACGPPPAPVASTRGDPTQQLWYGEAVTQLAALDRQAESLYQSGQSDEAAALVTKGESVATRILDVPRPTLAAMETVSDLDQLYGQMLLANRNYGWARLVFQKNRARWKTWKPATSAIAECDRHLGE